MRNYFFGEHGLERKAYLRPVSIAIPMFEAGKLEGMPKKPMNGVDPLIGDRLVICRKTKELGQAEAARRLGITAASLSDLESGKSKQPTGTTLLAMRDQLGYDIDYVMRGAGSPLIPNHEERLRETRLIQYYRTLGPQGRNNMLAMARSIAEAHQPSAEVAEAIIRDLLTVTSRTETTQPLPIHEHESAKNEAVNRTTDPNNYSSRATSGTSVPHATIPATKRKTSAKKKGRR